MSLPAGVNTAELPAEVRKYLINVDGSDAGAYDGTVIAGWEKDDAGRWFYRKADGTFVTNSWLTVDEKTYYMNWEGVMLADTITPDGIYVNLSGERTEYIPGWVQEGDRWRYLMKNGYYATNTWQEVNGLWYHFDMSGYMEADTVTTDGYYVSADGVWDGQPSNTSEEALERLGPGAIQNRNQGQWEATGDSWKYRRGDGSYITSEWFQDTDGKSRKRPHCPALDRSAAPLFAPAGQHSGSYKTDETAGLARQGRRDRPAPRSAAAGWSARRQLPAQTEARRWSAMRSRRFPPPRSGDRI